MNNVSIVAWGGFVLFVLAMLALDLGVFQRRRHVMRIKEALIWCGVWVGLAMIFNIGVILFHARGAQAGLEFFTGYLVEESLSIDNIFVFVLLFGYFKVPRAYQPKILMWGVVGALILRALFILGGLALMARFHWMNYVFGAFLVGTGISMMVKKEKPVDPQRNWVVRAFRRLFRVTEHCERDRFFTRRDGELWATPLFVALLAVESSDIIFATDSIPAIFAITPDPFIVFTSNIFAMLGVRSLYFVVSGLVQSFYFLRYGFASIILILGVKMLLSHVIEMPIAFSLVLIVFILLLCVIVSLLRPRRADLKRVFGRTARLGLIPFRELLYIENMIDSGNLVVRDVMRKREAVEVIRPDVPWEENLRMMRKTRFSRYPVDGGAAGGAKPQGILHVKDLALTDGAPPVNVAQLRALVRPGLEMREDLAVPLALARFRRQAHEMGLVMSARGEWLGIVTSEDLVEQFVGELTGDSALGRADRLFSLADALNPRRIVLGLQASTMREAIETIVHAIPRGELPVDAETAVRVFAPQPNEAPPVGNVIVRHARLDGIAAPVVVFARSEEGVEIGEVGQRAEFFFLILTSKQVAGVQPRVIASIARVLDSDYVRDRLRVAKTREEVIETIRTAEQVVPA